MAVYDWTIYLPASPDNPLQIATTAATVDFVGSQGTGAYRLLAEDRATVLAIVALGPGTAILRGDQLGVQTKSTKSGKK